MRSFLPPRAHLLSSSPTTSMTPPARKMIGNVCIGTHVHILDVWRSDSVFIICNVVISFVKQYKGLRHLSAK